MTNLCSCSIPFVGVSPQIQNKTVNLDQVVTVAAPSQRDSHVITFSFNGGSVVDWLYPSDRERDVDYARVLAAGGVRASSADASPFPAVLNLDRLDRDVRRVHAQITRVWVSVADEIVLLSIETAPGAHRDRVLQALNNQDAWRPPGRVFVITVTPGAPGREG